ncbi:hypothetical protein BC943DRAFT_325473 [Umbelopsis sp. AD052]|nr:hypothetical protein BC943DRAFT_325473 [Umbelopsis sp. AD052]
MGQCSKLFALGTIAWRTMWRLLITRFNCRYRLPSSTRKPLFPLFVIERGPYILALIMSLEVAIAFVKLYKAH